ANDQRILAGELAAEPAVDAHGVLERQLALELGALVDERGEPTGSRRAARRCGVVALDALASERGSRHHGILLCGSSEKGRPLPSAGWIGGPLGQLEARLSVHCGEAMEHAALPALFERALASGRLHSAYLISGPRDAAREAAAAFARASVCARAAICEKCDGCRRSAPREEIAIDGTGHSGPLFRHIGDHPDLFWVERGSEDTRVRIGQIRALQHALRLSAGEGGRRVAVIADAEWLNQEAQNALLRLLGEPPPRTALVLVTASPAGLLATVRSRCQRVALPPDPSDPLAAPEAAAWLERLDALPRMGVPELLDWAEEFRGQRGPAAAL